MNAIPNRYEIADAILEGESIDVVLSQSRKESRREPRSYSAEAIYDVLDPRAAILDGIPPRL